MMKKVLVTGGAGFVGCNLIRYILRERPDWEIINIDLLTYAGNLQSLADLEKHPRYRFIRGDVADVEVVDKAMQDCWGVLHLAAESHVDRSIEDPGPFLHTNVIGTRVMLDAARKHKVKRFVQVSTDEVYGSLESDDPAFSETTNLDPSSPYSASKVAGDLLARAYFKTYDLRVMITRCSNNIGPYQFPEKFVPLMLHNAMEGIDIPVYGDGLQVRDWLYVDDHCSALIAVLENGKPGEIYNIGASHELTNLQLTKTILKILKKPESLIKFVKDRPGHDRRYAINSSKIKAELGWDTRYNLEESIRKTVDWYSNNQDWVKSVISGEYLEYYQRQYEGR